MSKFKVVVSDNRHGDYSIEQRILSECDAELTVLDCKNAMDMIKKCKDANAILLDMAPLTTKVVESLESCQVVSRYGVGYDNVDVQACTSKGIYVANVPDYCAYDVSDMALALLFACQRHIVEKDRGVRKGEWNLNYPHTYRIKGKVLAVFGFGRISRALIKKVSGFELKEVLVYDPYVDEATISSAGARKVSFEEGLKQADYVSLHMPVTQETKGMFNDNAFLMMKPSAYIINTSRGPLINDSALLSALRNKTIAFAGLDTHNFEPLPANSEFFELENCVSDGSYGL